MLPHVVSKSICTGQLLNEMFDRVLSESEKVRSGDGVGVLPIPYRIGLFDNVGPRSSRCTGDDGTVCHVRSDYFELGAIPAVQDGTLVHSL